MDVGSVPCALPNAQLFMIKQILIFIVSILPTMAFCQTLSATYAVTQDINVVLGGKEKSISLNLKGHFYLKGQRSIYWESPDYLSKYPKGQIVVPTKSGNEIYALNTDTMQMLYYVDLNNLLMRVKPASGLPVEEHKIEKERVLNWEYKSETKTVNGLKCQLATATDQWKVWFCPDIPSRTGLFNISGLPGLVVEAELIPLNAHYTLQSYDTQSDIPEYVFEPGEFRTLAKKESVKTTPEQKDKTKKKQEIIKNNN